MKIEHPALIDSLRKAYSAERAACFAYIGHAGSLRNETEKLAIKRIEDDEWDHRRHVLEIMREYDIPVSKYYELKYYLIGKLIGYSCYLIGRFMPYFFAGKLESGNVCEYIVMIKHFHSLGIRKHDEILYEMGVREKEHEIHFLDVIKEEKWLPWFERIFNWGSRSSANDLDLKSILPVDKADAYCSLHKRQ